jgi:hypothetical protein
MMKLTRSRSVALPTSNQKMLDLVLLDVEVDTQFDKFFDLSIEKRIEALEDGCTMLNGKINSGIVLNKNPRLQGVLTAPEYFFANSTGHHADKPRHFSLQQYRNIDDKLRELSAKFPNILIVPGPIAWGQLGDSKGVFFYNYTPEELALALKDPQAFFPPSHAAVFCLCNHNLYHVDPLEMTAKCYILSDISPLGDVKRLHGTVLDATHLQSISLAIKNVPPENMILAYQPIPHAAAATDAPAIDAYQAILANPASAHIVAANGGSNRTRQDKLTFFQKHSPGELIIYRNTANFYFGGVCTYQYSKPTDFKEVANFGKPDIAVPGSTVPVFVLEGLTIGIEICLDHNCGVLRRHIDTRKNNRAGMLNRDLDIEVRPVDLHLILSACVENVPKNNCAKQAGYLIHSSSAPALRGCWTKTGVQPKDLGGQSSAIFLGISFAPRLIWVQPSSTEVYYHNPKYGY